MSYQVRTRKPRMLTENLFTKIEVYIPNGTYKILSDMAEEKGMPKSRLVAIAIDNELDAPKPFHYPCNIPTDEYKEFMYAKEANMILKWLGVTKGVNIESVMLCRRDLGLTSREEVLRALRDLFENDMIEKFKPKKVADGYDPTQKRIRVTEHVKQSLIVQTDSNREEVEDEQS